jgi:uncharacterized protein involved in exopolysaccharide biosynthesis
MTDVENTTITEVTQISVSPSPVFGIQEILKNIRERVLFVVLVTLFALVLAFIYNETLLPIFNTTSVINIKMDKRDITTGNENYEYEDYYARLSRLETHIQIMKSTPVVARLLNEPDIQQILVMERTYPVKQSLLFKSAKEKVTRFIHSLIDLKSTAPKGKETLAEDPSQVDVERLQDSIQAAMMPDTNLIEISVTDSHSQLATAVANALPKVYKEFLLENKLGNVKQSLDWMAQELNKIKAHIREQSSDSELFTTKEDFLAIEQSPEFISTEIGKMRSELNDVQNDLVELDAQITELKKVLAESLKYVPAFLKNEVLSEINLKLVQKQLELQAILKTYKNKHPDVVGKRSEIGFLAAEFNRELKRSLLSLESQLTVLKTKEKSLLDNISKYRSLASSKTGTNTELAILQEDIASNKELYQLLLKQMKTANITEAFLFSASLNWKSSSVKLYLSFSGSVIGQ